MRNSAKNDVLAQKKNKLSACVAQFNSAIAMITGTIDDLGRISQEIDDTIQEIDTYQTELATTRTGLVDAKDKNERVIRNFKSLLEIE